MAGQIIGLHEWFQTPAGQYLLRWENTQLSTAVADLFGYHAVQLGLPEISALQANRMPHRWLVASTSGEGALDSVLVSDFTALPFAQNSLDLLILPHALEFSQDAHATLREAERVLVPEGRLVICGFNPASLWGWKQRRARWWQRLGIGRLFLPDGGDFIGYWRLRDWLRLLNFEVESGNFGCYQPALHSQSWVDRLSWMDALGGRYWPIFGAAYCVVAVKRVRGMRMLTASFKRPARLANAPASIVPRADAPLRRK